MSHAIRIHKIGGPEVLSWDQVEVGEPSAGQVRVRQIAVGLNFIDTYHRSGLYPLPLPSGIGLEGSGVVEAVGEGVSGFQVGDRVAYAGGPIGSYAEVRCIPVATVLKLPDAINFETGAAMMLQGLTSAYLLRRTYRVQPGDTVLIHAIAGGVGLIACQWAKAIGAAVIGTTSSEEKAALAQAHGADHIIFYNREDVAKRVREITAGEGVPVVYDGVGRDTFAGSIDSLRMRGLLVCFGNASGPVPPVDPLLLSQKGSLFLTRPILAHHTAKRPELEELGGELFSLVSVGKVKIEINQHYALRDAAQAHTDLEARRTTGSTILVPKVGRRLGNKGRKPGTVESAVNAMGSEVKNRILSVRDLLGTAGFICLIVAIGVAIAYQFVEPAPPSKLVISTGVESGAYHVFAERYAKILKKSGITLELKPSKGALENIERLRNGEVDVAFVQGGVLPADSEQAEEARDVLYSIGSMYYEPVWVFYRHTRPISRLHDLTGKKIAIGDDGSGVRGLALQMLEANEISLNKNLVSYSGLDAAEALQQGWVDAAFIIAAPEAPVVQVLLRSPGVQVMSFSQADAYTKMFPFLKRVTLPRGTVDLVRDNPQRNIALLAATANLVVNEDTHPALVSLLMQAASEVHGKSGFFQRTGEFPSYQDATFELSSEAARYYKSGPPFLQRYLPFWAAVLVDRLVVLTLPLIALLLPLLRVAPSIYSWRVRSKVFRLYGELKFLENEVRLHYDPSRHDEFFERLERIDEAATSRNVPLAFSDLVYTLREHVHLVRKQLIRFEQTHRGNSQS